MRSIQKLFYEKVCFSDAPGFEEVPVELFYGVCEDMARDDNLKYRMLFDVSFHHIQDVKDARFCFRILVKQRVNFWVVFA